MDPILISYQYAQIGNGYLPLSHGKSSQAKKDYYMPLSKMHGS
jgi:hypothetical protein